MALPMAEQRLPSYHTERAIGWITTIAVVSMERVHFLFHIALSVVESWGNND
nr:MAG TPA: hypothetical protein [Caudoviricetes sp.]